MNTHIASTPCAGRPHRLAVIPSIVMSFCALAAAGTASATTLSSDSISPQTLGSGASLDINAGVSLTVGGSNVAVTVTGSGATLTNLGTVKQTGTGRAVFDNSSNGFTITNGSASNSSALIQTADADVVRVNSGGVTLNNYGTLTSLNASGGGSQAVDFNPITTGSNTSNNSAGGVMQASEADAVRPGVNGAVNNAGTIFSSTSTGSSSDGVDAQNNTGVVVTNATNWNPAAPATPGSGTIEGARHGITGGAANSAATFSTTVTNNLGGTIQGDNGSGINLDGFNALQSATIVNHGSIIGNGVTGDGDGIDVDGIVHITNTGLIRSVNAFSAVAGAPAQSEGVTVGGGTITNSGTIEGLVAAGNGNAVGRGISLLGNDITTGPLAGTREAIYGDATVTNQAGGLIRGDSDSAIAVDGPASGHTVTINNEAGATLRGGGTANAAIRTGADNDTITNAGTIDGSSGGKAIDMGGGSNTLTIQGGAAHVYGDINGGGGGVNALNFNIGSGNSFSYSGSLSNFANVNVNGGTTTLSGASSYSGPTTVNSGTLLVTNSSGSATGSGAVEVKSGAVFGGTGAITGPLTLDLGATLSPGAGGVGTLGVGGVTLNSGSTFAVDLDPGHNQADLLRVTGAVSLNLSDLVINLLSAPTPGQTFDILFNDGSDAISGFFNQGHTVFGVYNGQSYRFRIDYAYNADGGATGNDIRLTETVPEPGTGLLFGLGGLILALKRRRAKA